MEQFLQNQALRGSSQDGGWWSMSTTFRIRRPFPNALRLGVINNHCPPDAKAMLHLNHYSCLTQVVSYECHQLAIRKRACAAAEIKHYNTMTFRSRSKFAGSGYLSLIVTSFICNNVPFTLNDCRALLAKIDTQDGHLYGVCQI
jgi:hypothetical protein